jgi:hypothetical protein
MNRVVPPKEFIGAALRLYEVPAGHRFCRIHLSRYSDPLGFGKTPSRFSDPRRRRPANRFGVLYLGSTIEVAFLEAVLRDQRDGAIGDLPIAEAELHNRCYADIEVTEPLQMVDLRENGPVVMGVPTDVARASSQTLARTWALAFHEHQQRPDGIIYPSRLNGQTNLAVFDRAIIKLRKVQKVKLIDAPGLVMVLNNLRVCIVSPD